MRKKKNRLLMTIDKYKLLYQYSSKEEQLLISASTLNIIWNSWSLFWKNYFLIYIIGGYDTSNTLINGLHPSYTLDQANAYLASLKLHPHPDRYYRPGNNIAHYHEPNWGDCKFIINISIALSNRFSNLAIISSLFNNYRTEIEELQLIRNTFIHLNSNTIKNLDAIKHNFSFNPNQDIIDILDSTRINNTTKCFNSMLNNMYGLISYV